MAATRVAPAFSGLLFLALFVGGSFLQPEAPQDEGASADEIRAFYDRNARSMTAGLALGFVGLAFLLWFVGHLRDRVGGVAFGAGLVLAGLWMLVLALETAPFLLDRAAASDARVEAVFAFDLLAEAVGDATTVPRAVFVGAASAAFLRGGQFRALGWAGLPVAAACLAGVLFPLEAGPWGAVWFAGLVLFLAWFLALAITVPTAALRREVSA